MEPLVYIVIVNYRGYADTVACVRSLLRIDYENYKIIIVENASEDAEKIKRDDFLGDHTMILYADYNGGFSSGNNIGIHYALQFDPAYILLLNNDTTVTPHFLNELVGTAERNENTGIVTGRIYCYSKPYDLWYSGGRYNRNRGKTDQVLFDESVQGEKEVTFASGCLMLVSRECIDRVGLMDTEYFMYSEDTDYCCRVNDARMRILWTPKCIIYHKVSASAGNGSNFQLYYMTRNNLFMIEKYGYFKVKAYMYILFQSMKDIIKGRTGIEPVIWAYSDFLKGNRGISDRFQI